MDETRSKRRSCPWSPRRQLLRTSYQRANFTVGLLALAFAVVFLRWARGASNNPADWAFIEVLVWAALAVLQVLPMTGFLWMWLPPRRPRARHAWMIWVVFAVVELLLAGAVIAFVTVTT
jgi:hypothetical protein